MIIRGTTPYHSFILPILAEDINTIWVSYCQNEEIIFTRTELDESMSVDNLTDLYENASMEPLTEEEEQYSQLTIHLTQEETLKFHFYPAARKNIAVIQIRILTTDGEAYASAPVRERIFGVRPDGVIGAVQEEITNGQS